MNRQKLIIFPVLYWLVFIIIPFIIANNLKGQNLSFDIPGYILLYIIFLAPILFIIPYQFSKKDLSTKKAKLLFIVFGLVIPFLIIYTFLFNEILQMEGPRF